MAGVLELLLLLNCGEVSLWMCLSVIHLRDWCIRVVVVVELWVGELVGVSFGYTSKWLMWQLLLLSKLSFMHTFLENSQSPRLTRAIHVLNRGAA